MPRKTRLTKGYTDILAGGVYGIAGLGALHSLGAATGTSNSAMMGYAGSAMSIGAVGMPLMATGNLMGQMNDLGKMTERRRGRKR